MTKDQLIALMEANFNTGAENFITGSKLYNAFIQFIDMVFGAYGIGRFRGVCLTTTNPGTSMYNDFYITKYSNDAQTFTHFGLSANGGEICVFKYTTVWSKISIGIIQGGNAITPIIDFVAYKGSEVQYSNNPFEVESAQEFLFESRIVCDVAFAKIIWTIQQQNAENVLISAKRDVSFTPSGDGVYDVNVKLYDIDDTLIAEKDVEGFITVGSEDPPVENAVYLGYLSDLQDPVITANIVKGVTYPTQVMELDTAANHESFPDTVECGWKDEFAALDEFELYVQFLAIPAALLSSVYGYYQNMDFEMAKGAYSEEGTVEDLTVDDVAYKVFRLNETAPVNYRLSINSF